MSDSNGTTWEILQKYNQILNDTPEARTILAMDESLATFLLDTLIRSGDQKIIRTSLEIAFELTSCVGSKAKAILETDGNCKNAIMDIMTRFKADANIGFICESLLDQLFPGHRQVESANVSRANNRSKASRFLVGSSRHNLKTMLFDSSAFQDTGVKAAVERALVNIKGVVSIYFEVSRCIVRVFATVTPQQLAEAILELSSVTSVQYITKNQYGEEISILYESDAQDVETKATVQDKLLPPMPAYLDENDDIAFNLVIGDRAVTKYGETDNSKGGGWLSGVSSFFSKSLYW